MDGQGVSPSTANSMNMQGVSLSTASSMDVQIVPPFQHQQYGRAGCFLLHSQQYGRPGCVPFHSQQNELVSLFTTRSKDMQGVSPSTANSIDLQGVFPRPAVCTTSSVNVQGESQSFACGVYMQSVCISFLKYWNAGLSGTGIRGPVRCQNAPVPD